jgi:hypothetical protein
MPTKQPFIISRRLHTFFVIRLKNRITTAEAEPHNIVFMTAVAINWPSPGLLILPTEPALKAKNAKKSMHPPSEVS